MLNLESRGLLVYILPESCDGSENGAGLHALRWLGLICKRACLREIAEVMVSVLGWIWKVQLCEGTDVVGNAHCDWSKRGPGLLAPSWLGSVSKRVCFWGIDEVTLNVFWLLWCWGNEMWLFFLSKTCKPRIWFLSGRSFLMEVSLCKVILAAGARETLLTRLEYVLRDVPLGFDNQ